MGPTCGPWTRWDIRRNRGVSGRDQGDPYVLRPLTAHVRCGTVLHYTTSWLRAFQRPGQGPSGCIGALYDPLASPPMVATRPVKMHEINSSGAHPST